MNTVSTLGNGNERPARWSLRLFGGFELGVLPGGERVAPPGKRERVLLVYLALSPKGSQPRRKLATVLWGDAGEEISLDNLRSCLWNLRKALGDTEHRIVVSEGEDLVLDAAAFDVDALAFCRLAAQSGRTDLEAAANLYAGEFLDGLVIESEEFESWRRAEAARYKDQAIDVLTRLTTQLSECGETERAIATGGRILRLDPLHEDAVRRLMRHYGESGRRGAAIQLYRTFADALRTELDAQPEAATRAVFAELARGGEEQTSGPALADANLPLPTTSARSSDAPIRPSFRLRAPLAILAGVLIVATAFISYRQFAPLGAQPGLVAERAASADPASAISIAVLPFLNLSGDANQEFFSDGMTEEITAALAKVLDLKVVARTSAFQFKDEKNDIRAVGQALNATHLVEGSVRKVGDRVRITAQLIEVGNGTHLWSENYDRQLSDIFETQEEIARTIVGSLMTPLGLAPGERLVSNRAIDPDSYQQYLHARALVRARTLADAIAILEPVVARDRDYAPAWAMLAQAYALTPNTSQAFWSSDVERTRGVVGASLPRAEVAARRAIQLDPNDAEGYLALGITHDRRGEFLLAEELYIKALALDPNNPDALHGHSLLLAAVGRLKEALAMRQQLQALEPFVPVYYSNTATVLWLNGQDAAAIAILIALPSGRETFELPMIYASAGRYSEAADYLLKIPNGKYGSPLQIKEAVIKEAARLLRTAPAAGFSSQTTQSLGIFDFVHLYGDDPSRALGFHERSVEAGYLVSADTDEIWHRSFAPVRKTDRFKGFVRKAGLVDYWRVKGWPEFCHPTGPDDFVCV